MSLQALTANRLSNGRVVFLKEDGNWTLDVSEARAVEAETDIADLEGAGRDAEAAQLVTGAYLIEVARTANGVAPLRNKERIRALGPTVQITLNQSRNSAENPPLISSSSVSPCVSPCVSPTDSPQKVA